MTTATLKRHKDWRARLSAYVETCRTTPYDPGKHDCVLFAAGCIEAMTGVDLAAGWRGNYSTITEAIRAFRKAGYVNLLDLAEQHFEEVPVGRALSGDIAIIESDDDIGWNAGVFNGEVVFVLRVDGIGLLHRDRVAKAYRVPF